MLAVTCCVLCVVCCVVCCVVLCVVCVVMSLHTVYLYDFVCFKGSSSSQNCVGDQFRCPNGRCINRSAVCDFENDCGDNTDEQSTECSGYKERCNFESGTYCNWVQADTDTFDWSLRTSVSKLDHGEKTPRQC